MTDEPAEIWRPGSFTKNFRWGKSNGLRQLYDAINLGFDGELNPVDRKLFSERIRPTGLPDYIPLNFFLFNRTEKGVSQLAVDELVFQALSFEHSERFDSLALFAFNFSYVGSWKQNGPYQARKDKLQQSRPALWANHYVMDRLSKQLAWDISKVDADDIESFLRSSSNLSVENSTYRKIATNLNWLYRAGNLAPLSNDRVTRWWVDALFLALDRLIWDRKLRGLAVEESRLPEYLSQSSFHFVSGQRSIEKDLAAKHLVRLYVACGGDQRFSEDQVQDRTAVLLQDLPWNMANDPRPRGAVHRTNPRIQKSIPRACAMLARYIAGFEILSPDDLEEFDIAKFLEQRTQRALDIIRTEGLTPTMSAEEVLKITRSK